MEILQPAVALTLGLLLLVSGIGWRQVLKIRAGSGAILPYEPRRSVPWGGIDLVLLFLLLVLFAATTGGIVSSLWQVKPGTELEDLPPAARAAFLLSSALSTLLATLAAAILIRWRNFASSRDLGFDPAQLLRDLRLGGAAYLLLLGPVLLVQATLVTWWPSQHPLIELVKDEPDIGFLLVTGLSAIVIAPLWEEFVFRVLLQGWLEKLAAGRSSVAQLLWGEGIDRHTSPRSLSPDNRPRAEPAPAVPEPTDRAHPACSEYAVSERSASEQAEDPAVAGSLPDAVDQAGRTAETQRPPTWPILVSSAIFAAMHLGHGPDPIPLFLLALGLGYLYQRTHRIVPCIVVHGFLNAFSFTLLLLDVWGKPAVPGP